MSPAKKISALLAVALALGAVAMVAAQTGECSAVTATCVAGWEFDTDDDGWGDMQMDNTVTWNASKSFGFFSPVAETGVINSYPSAPDLYRSVNLVAGTYRVFARAGGDGWWPSNALNIIIHNDDGEQTVYAGTLGGWQSVYSSYFTHSGGDLTIEIAGDVVWLDAVWIMADAPATATPGVGTPTVTAIPATATPMPTNTPFCVAPTATPVFPSASNATPTVTPTPGGPVSGAWDQYERFSTSADFYALNEGVIWRAGGSGVRIVSNAGRQTSEQGAVYIPYSSGTLPDATEMTRAALIYQPVYPITETVYIDLFARASALYAGDGAYVEVWLQNDTTFQWSRALSSAVSVGVWNPIHLSPTLYGNIRAIAFLGSNLSGAPGGVYIDDVYMYGSLTRAPICGGWYVSGSPAPPGISPGGGLIIGPGSGPVDPSVNWDANTVSLLNWPTYKPCPPDINVPNNFWGYMLGNLHIMLLSVTAYSPLHEPLGMADMVISSPLVAYTAIAATFLDLRWPLRVAGAVIIIEMAFQVIGAWKAIKSLIPFL